MGARLVAPDPESGRQRGAQGDGAGLRVVRDARSGRPEALLHPGRHRGDRRPGRGAGAGGAHLPPYDQTLAATATSPPRGSATSILAANAGPAVPRPTRWATPARPPTARSRSTPAATARAPTRPTGCGPRPSSGRRPARPRSSPTSRPRSASPNVDTNFDWDNVQNLGLFTYLLSKRDGRDADAAGGRSPRRPPGSATSWRRRAGRPLRARHQRLLVGVERGGRAHGDEPLGRVPAQPGPQVSRHHRDAAGSPARPQRLRPHAGDRRSATTRPRTRTIAPR